jgi:hypothetical protein
MLGDGPNPIWFPEYKFQSFELLAAAISSVTGLTPITVFHLVLPLPEIALLTLILMLTLIPSVGRYWLAGAVLWIAFLFLNENTLQSWGVHGLIRFFQGKAFYVTALVPLLAALTIRWFRKGQLIDLVGLSLGVICAVGFEIAGLMVGPMAIALVAIAFVAASPLSRDVWRRLIPLLVTILYPAVVAVLCFCSDLTCLQRCLSRAPRLIRSTWSQPMALRVWQCWPVSRSAALGLSGRALPVKR